MKKLAAVMMAGTLWLAGTSFGQAPATPAPAANTTCPCGKNEGTCNMCRRGSGQGRAAMGRGPGRGRMMAMRGGGMGRGGACMRMMGQDTAVQPQSTPKTDKQ